MSMNNRKCTWACVGLLLLGVASLVGLARILWFAFEKVMSGQGLDTYRTAWLVEFNYIGVLVLFGAVILAFVFSGGLWLREWWQIRTLTKKYDKKSEGGSSAADPPSETLITTFLRLLGGSASLDPSYGNWASPRGQQTLPRGDACLKA